MTKNTSRGEMVTPSYTGNILGDPRGGRTRLLTNNICSGTNYYLGVQADGSRFLDSKGSWRFDGEGEQGANNASSALVYTKNDCFTKQDRRGTNIGKALKRRCVFRRDDRLGRCGRQLECCGGGRERVGRASHGHARFSWHVPRPVQHGEDIR